MKPLNRPTWRNHYLPQWYLANFCDDSRRVLRTFRGPRGDLYETRHAPRATGYEEDLYTFADSGLLFRGADADTIEREVFKPIDDRGAVAVRKVLAGSPSDLSTEDKRHLASLINSFLERHPQRIRERDKLAVEAARARVAALKQSFGVSPSGRRDVLDVLNVDALARNLHRSFMTQQIHDAQATDYLSTFSFIKVRIEDNPVLQFVTGDQPVLVNLGDPWPVHYLTLALDPSTLLVGHSFSEDLDTELLQNLMLLHNVQLFRQCEYVFSKTALIDTGAINNRTAAGRFLTPVAWRKK